MTITTAPTVEELQADIDELRAEVVELAARLDDHGRIIAALTHAVAGVGPELVGRLPAHLADALDLRGTR